MPKRSAEDKIHYYNKKIRKLERREQQKRRRAIRVIESSDSEVDVIADGDDTNVASSALAPPLERATDSVIPESNETTDTPPAVPELDPDILSALGEPVDDVPEFGEEIHETLAHRWLPLLKRGMAKDNKDKLLKEYLIPSNCSLLQAPKLNAEISAAITDMARNRDKKMESAQQLLGVGVSAINRAMTLLFTGEGKIEAIKMLSDSCRLLSHLHYTNTQARIKMITPGLDKSFLNVIKDNERDSTLFGIKLSEKIKASKTIEKQGLQIKKTTPVQKPPTQTVQSSVVRPRYQENWQGPSRYQSNRGGRGGQRRQAPAVRKAPPAPATQARSANSNKARAQPQQ